jgi:carboxyl-terminal processing protease
MRRHLAPLPIALGFVILLTGGCGSSSSTSSSSSPTADCSTTPGQNQQILDVFRSWYYWYPSIPASLNPGSYGTPQDLVSAIRAQQPLDRFSFVITHEASQAFFGAGQYLGYGLSFVFTAANELELTLSYPGSPADQAGMTRGDTITSLNGVSVPSLVSSGQLDSVLAVNAAGQTLAFTFTDRGGLSHDVTLTSAVVTSPSVDRVAVVSVGKHKVGYFLFNSFIDLSNAELDAAFVQFAREGVTDLVIDERYNGGGELQVAQHLASLIAGNDYTGKSLGVLTFNDKHQDQNQTSLFENVTNPLNLKRVFFITTGDSASASEFMINTLVPYLQVITVGGTTFGKPVGEDIFTVCSYDVFPITFKLENSAGFGDYFNGITPTCPADDDLTHPLGDPGEASLASALHFVATGSCGSGSAASQRERDLSRAARPPRTYGWHELLNAY